MAETTAIQWCNHTFNPWRGCQKVNAGCLNCYAEKDRSVMIHGIKWGTESQGGTRVRLSDAGWKKPLAWDRDALLTSGDGPMFGCIPRPRVFCASLADVFEDWQGPILDHHGDQLCIIHGDGTAGGHEGYQYTKAEGRKSYVCRATMDDLRADLFRLIDATPNLDWILLTKRPENIWRMITSVNWYRWPVDVLWLGASASDQETADAAIPELLKCRNLASKLFLSLEPLTGPVDLSPWLTGNSYEQWANGGGGRECPHGITCGILCRECQKLDLVIVGGESGPNARPCNIEWIRSIVQQCKAASVPVFVKQLGAVAVGETRCSRCGRSDGGWSALQCADGQVRCPNCPGVMSDKWNTNHPKGGDPSEWSEDLRVREMPT